MTLIEHEEFEFSINRVGTFQFGIRSSCGFIEVTYRQSVEYSKSFKSVYKVNIRDFSWTAIQSNYFFWELGTLVYLFEITFIQSVCFESNLENASEGILIFFRVMIWKLTNFNILQHFFS